MQEIPIPLQLGSMNLCPGLDEALLRLRQVATQALDRVERKHHDAKETRDFRHVSTLHRRRLSCRANVVQVASANPRPGCGRTAGRTFPLPCDAAIVIGATPVVNGFKVTMMRTRGC